MPTDTINDSWVRKIHDELSKRLNALIHKPTPTTNPQHWADSLIEDAIDVGASDIHISIQDDCATVRMRVDGVLHDARRLSVEDGERLIRHFKVMADLDPTPIFEPAEARRTYRVNGTETDLRISCTPTITGERMAIRLLRPDALKRSINELGMTEKHLERIHKWIHSMGGTLLVAGPTGSGKTTTLYALLHHFKTLDKSVITIEDPVEYQVEGIDQIQVDPRHGLDYTAGIKTILRHDPDIILVGELRDPESVRASIQASLSGHVVLSTLHARDAAGVVSSLRHWNVPAHELANTLQLVVAQRLVRTLCPDCRHQDKPRDVETEWLKALGLPVPDTVFRAVGCTQCHGLGYRGRTGVFEVWSLDQQDQQAVANGLNESQLRQRLRERGDESLLEQGLELVKQGKTTLAELGRISSLFVPEHQKS
ncbi:MAG: GspE/PulE family protein [Phycisphaeraceae bacterium]